MGLAYLLFEVVINARKLLHLLWLVSSSKMSLNKNGTHLSVFLPRYPPTQLVSVHCSSLHDCDPVGGRLQWANQTAAADLPGSRHWGCKGTEGIIWLNVNVQNQKSSTLKLNDKILVYI